MFRIWSKIGEFRLGKPGLSGDLQVGIDRLGQRVEIRSATLSFLILKLSIIAEQHTAAQVPVSGEGLAVQCLHSRIF